MQGQTEGSQMMRQMMLQKIENDRRARADERATEADARAARLEQSNAKLADARETRAGTETASRIERDRAQIERDRAGAKLDEARAQQVRAGGPTRGAGGPSYAEQRRMLFEELTEQGMSPEEANRRVRLEFGLTVPTRGRTTSSGGGGTAADDFQRAADALKAEGGPANDAARARYDAIVTAIARRRGMMK